MINLRSKKIFLLFLVIILIVFILFMVVIKISNNSSKQASVWRNEAGRPSVIIKNYRINVDIADSPEKRARGLSDRLSLGENEGVFFIFDEPDFYSFWMKDMNFPIDIIWISDGFKIVDITKNALPESFPRTFAPSAPSRYVLEVNAGWSEHNDIKIGDNVLLNR